TDGGAAFANIPGATAGTLSFAPSPLQSGFRYRAVFTNSCGTATTSVAVMTVYDTCLKDTSSGNIFQFNSRTGEYRFIRCSDRFTITGKASLTATGSNLILTDNQPDHRLQSIFNLAQLTGSATIILIPAPGVSQTIRIIDITSQGKGCGC